MTHILDYVIIGSGVIGSSIAWELSRKYGNKDIFVVEKNPSLRGENQSSRNSGVIHAGIYYPNPTNENPSKAELCIRGNRMLYDFCEEHGVPYKKTGKLVVSTNDIERGYLNHVITTAFNNYDLFGKGCNSGLKVLSFKEIREKEPNIGPEVKAALYVPDSGIVDSAGLVQRLHALAEKNGVNFAAGKEVVGMKHSGKNIELELISRSKKETVEAGFVINASGLHSDRIARMINPDFEYTIEPMRGESAKFYVTNNNSSRIGISHNIYPAPYPVDSNGDKINIPFYEFESRNRKPDISMTVGVHLTPVFDLVDGEYATGRTFTIGPALVGGVGLEDLASTRREEYYLEMVKPFFPNLMREDIHLHQAGIKASLEYNVMNNREFVIERDPYNNIINLVGIDSPGLTASLAIAKTVIDMI